MMIIKKEQLGSLANFSYNKFLEKVFNMIKAALPNLQMEDNKILTFIKNSSDEALKYNIIYEDDIIDYMLLKLHYPQLRKTLHQIEVQEILNYPDRNWRTKFELLADLMVK